MPFAPYQWRAGTGYIPPKDSVPMPIAPMYQTYACPPTSTSTYAHWIVQAPSQQAVVAAEPPAPAPVPKKKKKSTPSPPPPPPPPPPPAALSVVSEASSAPKTIVKGSGWRMVGKTAGMITVEIPPPPPPQSEAPQKEKAKKVVVVQEQQQQQQQKKPKKRIVCIPPPPPPPPSCSISPSDSVSAHSTTGSGTSLGSAGKKSGKSKCCPTTGTTTTTTTRTEITISSSKRGKLSRLNVLSLRGGDATVVAGGAAAAAEDTETTCPTVLPGVNYMFPRKKEHTILHIFSKAAPVWEEKYQGQAMAFKMFKVTTKFTVKDVIERVLKKEGGEACGGWGATECHEQGEGCWKKGTTIPYNSEKAAGSLSSMGWDARRGKERGPVWLVVHKV